MKTISSVLLFLGSVFCGIGFWPGNFEFISIANAAAEEENKCYKKALHTCSYSKASCEDGGRRCEDFNNNPKDKYALMQYPHDWVCAVIDWRWDQTRYNLGLPQDTTGISKVSHETVLVLGPFDHHAEAGNKVPGYEKLNNVKIEYCVRSNTCDCNAAPADDENQTPLCKNLGTSHLDAPVKLQIPNEKSSKCIGNPG